MMSRSGLMLTTMMILVARVGFGADATAEDFRNTFPCSTTASGAVRPLLIPQAQISTVINRVNSGDAITIDRWEQLLDRVDDMKLQQKDHGADAASLALIVGIARGDLHLAGRTINGTGASVAALKDRMSLAFENSLKNLNEWDSDQVTDYLKKVHNVDRASSTQAQLIEAKEQVGLGWGVHIGMEMDQLALAIAYDCGYGELSNDLRLRIRAQLMSGLSRCATHLAQNTWHVNQTNNRVATFAAMGIAIALVIRESELPGEVTYSTSRATVPRADVPVDKPENTEKYTGKVTASYSEACAMVMEKALPILSRHLAKVKDNGGGWPEGPGYQSLGFGSIYDVHAMVASGIAGGTSSNPIRTAVDEFLGMGIDSAECFGRAAVHLARNSGIRGGLDDYLYSEGDWPLSPRPFNWYVASLARDNQATQFRLMVWMAEAKWLAWDGNESGVVGLLRRSLFSWTQTPGENPRQGMKGWRPGDDADSTSVRLSPIDPGLTASDYSSLHNTEEINIWRTAWSTSGVNPVNDGRTGAALFFKGGRRLDDNEHTVLDAASFQYDALGVNWASDLGKGGDYIGKGSWGRYMKRACGHNTLVVNPQRSPWSSWDMDDLRAYMEQSINDRTDLNAAQKRTMLDGVPTRIQAKLADVIVNDRPDQALLQMGACSMLPGFPMATGNNWRAKLDIEPTYREFGLRAGSSRQMDFDRLTGRATITDHLVFDGMPDNEVWWYMHYRRPGGNVDEARLTSARTIRLTRYSMGKEERPVFLDVSWRTIPELPSSQVQFAFGDINQNLPISYNQEPMKSALFNYKPYETAKMLRDFGKVSLRLNGLPKNSAIDLAVTLNPVLPVWLKDGALTQLKELLGSGPYSHPTWVVGMARLNTPWGEVRGNSTWDEHSVSRNAIVDAPAGHSYTVSGTTTCGIDVVDDPARGLIRFVPHGATNLGPGGPMPSSPIPGNGQLTLVLRDANTTVESTFNISIKVNGILITGIDNYSRIPDGGRIQSLDGSDTWTMDAWNGAGSTIVMRGRAVPGTTVKFFTYTGLQMIEVPNNTATPDEDGNWAWTLPANLVPAVGGSVNLAASGQEYFYAYTTITRGINSAPRIITTGASSTVVTLP